MTEKKPGLDDAYAMKTPEDSRRLYRTWARTYDTEFVTSQDYRLPFLVAEAFHRTGGHGPVLDVGAGTGLCGVRLAELGVGPLDGVDIAPEMLAEADEKRLYSRLFEGDITQTLAVADGSYRGIISAGTFTLGHVGPTAIGELLRVAGAGALLVLSVNAAHFRSAGFEDYFAGLTGRITQPEFPEVAIYGPSADASHRDDHALLATFRKL